MIVCPYCDASVIKGADACAQCGQALSDLDLPDFASEVERCLTSEPVQHLSHARPVTTVSPDTAVGQVLQMLADQAIGCVVVTDNERVVGIFSERDALLKLNAEVDELADLPVSQFMTTAPQVLEEDANIAFAVQRMDLGGYRHVPIVDEQQQPVALISVRDILKYLTGKMVGQSA